MDALTHTQKVRIDGHVHVMKSSRERSRSPAAINTNYPSLHSSFLLFALSLDDLFLGPCSSSLDIPPGHICNLDKVYTYEQEELEWKRILVLFLARQDRTLRWVFLGSRTNDYRTLRVDTNMLDALFAVSNGNLVWKLFTDIGHPRACLLHCPANRVSR